MKIRVFSDLHLEFDDFEYYRLDEDVIVLAGDIHNKNQLHQFLAKLPTDIPIIFVPGNHEYFRNDYDIVNNYFIRLAGHIPNFHVLLNTNITVNGVEFFGGAMFTDFQLYGCQNEWFCHNKIKRWPDFTLINRNGKLWTFQDHKDEHENFKQEFKHWLKVTEGRKRVVVTHFVPTEKCTHPRFVNAVENPYFTANMEQYMGWDGLWIFGHTHDAYDIMVGETRLLCNPRGYPDECDTGFNSDLIVEI